MDKASHRLLSVVYQLYSVTDGEQTLEEQTSTDRPFVFLTGFGQALDAFETHVMKVDKGDTFDFTLSPTEAFGEYNPEGVHKMEREAFTINGRFDAEHIYGGAVITLVDAEENPVMATVKEVTPDSVILDANHPLAGKTLNFTGLVRENREATEEEVQQLIKQLASGCCGCHEDGQGCGHCQKGEGGCEK